jgi:hypothetical protein
MSKDSTSQSDGSPEKATRMLECEVSRSPYCRVPGPSSTLRRTRFVGRMGWSFGIISVYLQLLKTVSADLCTLGSIRDGKRDDDRCLLRGARGGDSRG